MRLLLPLLILVALVVAGWAEEGGGEVTVRIRADPCVTAVKAFSLTEMRPIEVRLRGGVFEFVAKQRDTVEMVADAEGCRVVGWVEEARELLNRVERMTWTATYDAEFTVVVERPDAYLQVDANPPRCLGPLSTDPPAEVRRLDGSLLIGPFYRDSRVTLIVGAAEGCSLVAIRQTSPAAVSFPGPSASLHMAGNATVSALFQTALETAPAPEPEPVEETTPRPAAPQIPGEALPLMLLLAASTAATAAGVGAARRRAQARRYEREVAASVLRQWVRRGRTSSTVFAILASRPAHAPFTPSELLAAARRGSLFFDSLNLYRRGQGALIYASIPFEALNSDELLCLHAAAHLAAAGVAPASPEERERLRAKLLPRWYRMVREGRLGEAEEEARRLVHELRSSPEERALRERLREVEAERHPFIQDLISAALSELGIREHEEAPRPVQEAGAPTPGPPAPPPLQPRPEEQPTPASPAAPPRQPEPAAPPVPPEPRPETAPPPPPPPPPPTPVQLQPEPVAAPPEPQPAPQAEEVAIIGPRDLYRLFRERGPVRIEGAIPLEILGGAALMAAERGDEAALEAMAESVRGAGVAVRPSSLGEAAVYYPGEGERLLDRVALLSTRQHLACLVADVVGGVPVRARPGAEALGAAIIIDEGVDEDVAALAQLLRESGSPVRVATYSRERAEALSRALGVRAVEVGGILESEAALLLEAAGPLPPRLFLALAGASLLVPGLREGLSEPPAPGVFERVLAPPPCHVVRGFRALVAALERVAAGRRASSVAAALMVELRDSEAAEALAELLEPRGGEELELTPEGLLDLIRSGRRIEEAEAPLEAAGEAALAAAAQGDTAALSSLLDLVSSGTLALRDPAPRGEACYPRLTPEAAQLLAKLSTEAHAACLARRLAPGLRVFQDAGRAREAGVEAAPVDVAGWVAGRVLRGFARNGLPPNPLLFLAAVGASLLVPEVADDLESGRGRDPAEEVERMAEVAARVRTCHEPAKGARAAAAGIIRLASLGYGYGRLRERYGELAALITLRGAGRGEAEAAGREERLRSWLAVTYTGSGYVVRVEASAAPRRAVVVLRRAERPVPARIPVSSDLPSVPLEEAPEEPPEGGIVVTFAQLGPERRLLGRLWALLRSPGDARVVAVGFLPEDAEPPEGVEVVEDALDPKHIAEQAAELRLPTQLCEALPQVLAARGLGRAEAAERVRKVLEELLAGTGYEFLARLAESAVAGRKPPVEALSRAQLSIARSLGLL